MTEEQEFQEAALFVCIAAELTLEWFSPLVA